MIDPWPADLIQPQGMGSPPPGTPGWYSVQTQQTLREVISVLRDTSAQLYRALLDVTKDREHDPAQRAAYGIAQTAWDYRAAALERLARHD